MISVRSLKGRLLPSGSQTVIGIEFHAVHHDGVFIVIYDKIQADPLDGVFHFIDLYRAGEVPAGSAARSAQASLAYYGILGTVRQCPCTAQFLLADLLDLSCPGIRTA